MKFETSSGCATACCEPACFEGVITGPWPSCLVETCYSRTTTTAGTPSLPNGAFVIDSNGTIPIQSCDLSMYGTAGGSSAFPAPWITEGTVMSIRDDNNVCPGEVGMVRLDAGDRIGVTVDLNAGVVYRANFMFRNIDGSNGAGAAQVRVVSPSGAETVFGPRSTTRVGGNAGWDRFGTNLLGSDSTITVSETGAHTFWFEATAGAIRAINISVSVFNNSGEVLEPVTTIEYFRSETVGDVTTWFDRNGNTVSQPTGELVAIDCPLP